MKVKMILPALKEAKSPFWRPIKYSLFPPLSLATLAGYFNPDDQVEIQDEHVEVVDLADEPDLVVLQVYITSAYRAYEIADHYRAKGVHVAMGGLHVTARPDEAAQPADSIFLGPGEDTWPVFLDDFRAGHPGKVYRSTRRSLQGMPPIRRDLIKRELYLVPNSIVVSRGCPHACDFCYKDSFFKGGKSFYVQPVDDALAEIDRLPGRHLFFLDDHLFGNKRFINALFDGMKGMGRIWQAAATVQSVLSPGMLERAVEAGLRSLFIGFETLNPNSLREQNKIHNLNRDYREAVRRMHDLGVMTSASFVFGMDHDDDTVFDHTVEWAVEQGIEIGTFHILTPYPGTALYERLSGAARIISHNWDWYDARHVVFQPANMTPETLQAGFERAYRKFYSWSSIFKAAATKPFLGEGLRHLAYTGGWKKFEPMWDVAIKAGQVSRFLPLLETILAGFDRNGGSQQQNYSERIEAVNLDILY